MGGRTLSGWPHIRERVTVIDVLEEGACWEGVRRWVEREGRIAGPVAAEADEHILRAARLDGYGSGYGDGDGSGDGYGYGSGDGYGYGDGE